MTYTKKRIGFFLTSLRNCGPTNMVFSLIKGLDKSKFDIMLIAKRNCNTLYFKEIEKYCTLGIVHLGKKPREELNSISDGLDIIHSHGFYPDILVSSIKNNRILKVTTVHCKIFNDYILEFGYIRGIIASLVHLYFLNTGKFNKIVSCSSSIKKYLEKFIFSRNKLFHVNNGIDTDKFYKLNNIEREVLRKNITPNSELVFIYSGRIIRRKRVPELITKFQNLFKSRKNITLIIIGDGDELEYSKKISNENIMFLGNVENPELYYRISDFILSMSSAEGYPMSILEGVSCGCYAFLSDIDSHREFIINNPTSADFFDNLSPSIEIKEQDKETQYNISHFKMANHYTTLYQE